MSLIKDMEKKYFPINEEEHKYILENVSDYKEYIESKDSWRLINKSIFTYFSFAKILIENKDENTLKINDIESFMKFETKFRKLLYKSIQTIEQIIKSYVYCKTKNKKIFNYTLGKLILELKKKDEENEYIKEFENIEKIRNKVMHFNILLEFKEYKDIFNSFKKIISLIIGKGNFFNKFEEKYKDLIKELNKRTKYAEKYN